MALVNATAVVVAPLHRVWSLTGSATGVGFTVIVNVSGAPGQPLAVGVTVTVETTGAVPVFVALKEAILPEPVAARPIDGVSFVQSYVVPVVAPVKLIAVVADPLHSVWSVTGFTVGVGFTVIVNVSGVPGQPLAVGVTVTVAVTGAAVVFTPVKPAMFPLPVAAKPIEGVSFVQS